MSFGTIVGTWTSRVPAIKAGLDLRDAQLSIALVAFTLGSITGMVGFGRYVDQVGSGRFMTVLVAAQGAFLIPPALAPSLWWLCAALFVLGLAQGNLNVAMNTNATEVERACGRPIMSSFHAVFSLGGLLGAAMGGLLAGIGVGPLMNFVLVCCGALAVSVTAAHWRLRATDSAEPVDAGVQKGSSGSPPKQRFVVLLGLLAMFAMVAEGAAGDWSAVYLHSTLGTSTAFAAVAFVGFSTAMLVARLFGDRIVDRVGPVHLVRWSALLAAGGFSVGSLVIETPISAIIGFAALGAGLAGITPQIYSFAGRLTSGGAGRRLSIIVGLGYAGFLLGPALIGFISSLTGLRGALTVPAVLVLLVAIGAGVLKVPRRDP